MHKQILTTPLGDTYPIMTGSGILDSIGEMLAEIVKPCRAMILTDSNVAPLYLECAAKSLEKAGAAHHQADNDLPGRQVLKLAEKVIAQA